jgi:hypothetical protein
MVTSSTSALTFKNSTFLPQSLAFIRFLDETAIISLNSINQLLYGIEQFYVFFEVGTEFLNII